MTKWKKNILQLWSICICQYRAPDEENKLNVNSNPKLCIRSIHQFSDLGTKTFASGNLIKSDFVVFTNTSWQIIFLAINLPNVVLQCIGHLGTC